MADSNDNLPGRRIAVLGTSGCGKTYVAKRLAEVLQVPYVCSDAILWGPNWTWKPIQQQLAGYDQATRAESWTFDGNLGRVTKAENRLVLDRVDTLVWLDLPLFEILPQLLRRTVRRAWTQEPLWHGNRESWRLSFCSRESILLWSLRTYHINRRRYVTMFEDENYAHLRRIRLTRRREVDRWLASLAVDSD